MKQNREYIYQSGRNPKRTTLLVKLVRRILWPFIRPYMYTIADEIQEIQAQLNELQSLKRERENLNYQLVSLKSDIEAMKNLYTFNKSIYETTGDTDINLSNKERDQ